MLIVRTSDKGYAIEIIPLCPSRRRSAKEHTTDWRKEFSNQFADILSHSLPMALPAGLFVMQQVCLPVLACCQPELPILICTRLS